MKILHILTLLLVALVAYTSAQQCPIVRGGPTCRGARNVGRGGRGCRARTMWYWDTRGRQCRSMRYLGCGGNNNRWCSLAECQRGCAGRSG